MSFKGFEGLLVLNRIVTMAFNQFAIDYALVFYALANVLNNLL